MTVDLEEEGATILRHCGHGIKMKKNNSETPDMPHGESSVLWLVWQRLRVRLSSGVMNPGDVSGSRSVVGAGSV